MITSESALKSSLPMSEPVEQWAAITGRWEFSSGRATYLGPEAGEKSQPFGVALASLQIRDGQVETQIRLSRREKTAGGVVLGYQSLGAPYLAATLGSFEKAYAIVEFRPGFGWVNIDSAGSISNLEVEKTHDLSVSIAGQTIRLIVNEVEVLKTLLPRPLEGTGVGLYAWDDAKVTFVRTTVTGLKPSAFVIMPFAEPYDSLYRDVIAPIATKCGFDIVRIDEVPGPGIILNDIQQQIQRANVVVAEISTQNPNVFYELGYAHALDKPAVLLVRREHASQMPFDVRGYRAIFYDDSIAGKKIVERNLEQNFRAILPN